MCDLQNVFYLSYLPDQIGCLGGNFLIEIVRDCQKIDPLLRRLKTGNFIPVKSSSCSPKECHLKVWLMKTKCLLEYALWIGTAVGIMRTGDFAMAFTLSKTNFVIRAYFSTYSIDFCIAKTT